jgi:hypothetical protein
MHNPDASGHDRGDTGDRSSGARSEQAEDTRVAYWRAASPAEHARVMCELSDRALEEAKAQGRQPEYKSLPSLARHLSLRGDDGDGTGKQEPGEH